MNTSTLGPRRWAMLALATGASTSATMILGAGGFLIPALLSQRGLSLSQAGLVAAMTSFGITVTLIGWGFLIDRWGERFTLAAGLCLAGLSTGLAILHPDPRWMGGCFLLAGMACGSTNAASGRIVVGWFSPSQRGLAMGIRQTAQPLGMGIDALSLPLIATRADLTTALIVPAVIALLFATLVILCVDVPQSPTASATATVRDPNPYLSGSFLWLIHLVATLLVIPQTLLWTFMFTWLNHHLGWSETSAGALVAFSNFLGAAGRISAGVWSDRVGSRTWVIRAIALGATAILGSLSLASAFSATTLAIILMVCASVITVADNGLAFTSVAECAGPQWSGRAMGTHNTFQFLFSFFVPPCCGWLIETTSYTSAFTVSTVIAALAIPLVPHDTGEQPHLTVTGEQESL